MWSRDSAQGERGAAGEPGERVSYFKAFQITVVLITFWAFTWIRLRFRETQESLALQELQDWE